MTKMGGEGQEHKKLKTCAALIFGGRTEKVVNGRVDVKAPGFCVEIETTGRSDGVKRAMKRLSSSECGGGFLVVPPDALSKTKRLVTDKRNIIVIPSDKLKKICRKL